MNNFLFLNYIALDANADFTILWILLSGILVFFMQAGFTLVESGFTRSKNAVNISMKNVLDISVGTISYWIIGYGLMYGASNGIGDGDGKALVHKSPCRIGCFNNDIMGSDMSIGGCT